MSRLVVSRAAHADLLEIWAYVAENRTLAAADRVVDRLTAQWDDLARFPTMGRTRADLGPGFRSIPSGSYVTYYRLAGNVVEISRVLHAARDIAGTLGLHEALLGGRDSRGSGSAQNSSCERTCSRPDLTRVARRSATRPKAARAAPHQRRGPRTGSIAPAAMPYFPTPTWRRADLPDARSVTFSVHLPGTSLRARSKVTANLPSLAP